MLDEDLMIRGDGIPSFVLFYMVEINREIIFTWTNYDIIGTQNLSPLELDNNTDRTIKIHVISVPNFVSYS